ncbi:MAG: shikimate kinase [Bacteroidota bacterium]
MQDTIYLIGFMGSGKSHVGKKLAAALYCPFSDLDALIESGSGLPIRDIFAQYGEAYFRLLERRVLHDTAHGPKRIVATGGGAPCFFNNMEWINRHGLAIYLEASPEVLAERLWRGRTKRPLVASLQKEELLPFIKRKIAERSDYYQQAPVRYKITDSLQDTASDLLHNLEQITGH